LDLRGDETVLDVGPGHGLLLIGAAKRLPRGRAMGIDL
jgi:cyclopropane fatty-acyl-phospholipid synthase-like methyltransferase